MLNHSPNKVILHIYPRPEEMVPTLITGHRMWHIIRVYAVCYLYNSSLATFRGTCLFVCVEVLWPNQLNGVMSSAVSLSNRTSTGQA